MGVLKHPRTANEIRAYHEALCEAGAYDLRVRAKRNPNNLPTLRDDKFRTNVFARGWKWFRSRRHQWR